MSKPASWHDLSKTTQSGMSIVEFRLRLPKGDVVLRQQPTAPFDPNIPANGEWTVKCVGIGLVETPFKAKDAEKAKAQAVAAVKARLEEMAKTVATCNETLAKMGIK